MKIKKWFCIIIPFLVLIKVNAQTSFDPKVQELLSKMTLEEKAGQMTQIDIRNLLTKGYGNTDQKLDTAKLREAVQKYHVGSLLNCIEAYSGAKWQELINQIQQESQKTRLKIPIVYGTDAVHGVGFLKEATMMPQQIALAATRNEGLVKSTASITAQEARAVGLTWNFAPVLDVGREPYWSRFEETFGEDPYLVSRLGVQMVKGMEGSDLKNKNTTASCLKHFIGYSAPKNGIDRTPSHIPEIILREYYLPPFKAAVEAGAASIMINSAENNGVPTHGNKWLLTDLLRGELKFEGVACSDWEDVIRLHTWHQVAATPKEAVEMAVNAGVDMSMVPNDYSFYDYMIELVKEGKITEKRLNEAVGRILTMKMKLNLMQDPFVKASELSQIGTAASHEVSLKAATESIILLKNENNLLPLNKNKRILLAGPAAHSRTALNGSWTYNWQGDNEKLFPAEILSIKQALEKEAGKKNVISTATNTFSDKANYPADFGKSSDYDVIVLCLGENAYAEQPGVIKDLNLPEDQKQLVRKAKATGKPVIIILLEGRPRLFPESEPLANAILLGLRPGNYGAQAIASILYGKESPSGKLPFTYPRHHGDIQAYDHKFKETEQQLSPGVSEFVAFNPQWHFGHGLSYTTFAYSNLSVDKSTFGASDTIRVTVSIKNTGKVASKTATELYSRDHFASIVPSVRRLRGFTKVELQPGEEKKIQFKITASDLAFINAANKSVTEPGKFDLMVENLKTEITYK